MNDINQPFGDNLGGVLRFNFIDVNDIESIDVAVNSMVLQAVTLKTAKQWFAGYGTRGSIGYSETPEITNAGTLYKRQFVAFCPKDGPDNDDLFNEMRNKQFIIDYTDGNGLRKLVGSLEEPLFFSATLNTKTNTPELAGHSISFYGDATYKAYVYIP